MKFKPMAFADFPQYKKYFRDQKYDLCSYSLASIMAWQTEAFVPLAAIVDDALIVGCEFKKEKQNRHLLLPISPNGNDTPEYLHSLVRRSGFNAVWNVPVEYIDRFGREKIERWFRIENHGAFDDYVYLKDDLAFLKGNRYSKKRNLIRQFQREYESRGRVIVEPMTPASAGECLDFLETWCSERKCDADVESDLACEKTAAINTINNLERFEVNGLQLRIDGKINAFGISAHLNEEMATLQYEKAFSSVKGLYQYFDSMCAKLLFTDYRYINKENDMGLPGLSKAKKSYHPVRMVKSYKLILKT